jgi:hypothetical protein
MPATRTYNPDSDLIGLTQRTQISVPLKSIVQQPQGLTAAEMDVDYGFAVRAKKGKLNQ